MNLGDRVLGPTLRAEPVGTRVEVRLKDRFEEQLERGLHRPVRRGRYPQRAQLAVALGDQSLPHRQRGERARLELGPQTGQELVLGSVEVAGPDPVDPGRPCSSIAPHPIPRHHQERGVGDKIEQIIEPATAVVGRPLVQLGLDLQYPALGRIQLGFAGRIAGIHRRPPDIPVTFGCELAGPLRHVAGSPDLGLLRALRPSRTVGRRWACPPPPWLGGRRGRSRNGSHVH